MIFKSDVLFVFIFIKYDFAYAATIENMFVPEVVQSGSIEVALCCQYSSLLGNDSVHWLFNGNEVPERWNMSIKNSDIMGSQERFNSQALASVMKQSLLSFQRVTRAMSGNYTCEVHSRGATVQQTKRMSVFSPENDFTLKINYPKHRTVDVDCTAWGLYPTPEITLEIDNKPVSKQIQRVWWTEETAFRAEGSASIRDLAAGTHEVTCRLYLPLADYTAIMKKFVNIGPENDFTLKINYPKHRTVDVDCTAWGLYPTPEITLEIDNKPVSKQIQRVWWTEETAFRAEGSASIRDLAAGTHEVTCRLYLPLADYTAIMKKFVNIDNAMCCGSHSAVSSAAILVSTTLVWLASRPLVYQP